MMKLFLKTLLAAVLLSGCFCVATAETMTGYNVNTVAVPLNDGYGLTVESIEFRNDLTRVNCKLKGRPNTSHRIDSASLGGKSATDIDGVDFNRYFQFEEDGVIPLSIDFPRMKPQKKLTLSLNGINGRADFQIIKE